ncbi:glycosyltransferase [Nocardioides jejuensis]|uniref:Uncharacterized protein n=1 Tax=Nocardioides jejuensis TaxID=2502782 RepID=A0A4R1BT75_9ACTN|nr:glycosyltransferase [Nocardioides jejuensis]TCJ21054.1 hypothetical protein EPD65_15825 [Nocardioides jejuensis]
MRNEFRKYAPAPLKAAARKARSRLAGQEPGAPAGTVSPLEDERFGTWFGRVAWNLLGEERVPELPLAGFDPKLANDTVAAAKAAAAAASYVDRIASGDDTTTAAIGTIRAILATRRRPVARSFAAGLANGPDGERVSRAGFALCLIAMERRTSAWEQLKELDAPFLAQHLPVETVDTALVLGTPEALELALHIGDDPTALSTEAVVALAGRYLIAGHVDLARKVQAEALTRTGLDEASEHQRANVTRWLEPAPAVEPVEGRINFGVFDYYQPDFPFASGNVGDYVQTLAMMGNLARFQDVTYHGADGLGELTNQLQSRVRTELKITDGPSAEVELHPVSRDYSEGDNLPENTWLLAFGWHMHPLFKIRHGMPYHQNLNPIFVAFHINRPALLTPETIEYLKAHGPIGCRDWTTVYLLLSAGVDAFFTGCLTTTVNAVFKDRDQVEQDPDQVIAAIDVPLRKVKSRERPIEQISQVGMEYRHLDLVGGVKAADDLLQTYLRRYARIVTSRLHSYLPATSLGVEVNFKPHVPGDVRFDGLYGMQPTNEPFVEMRDGIRALLKETFGKVFAGGTKEEVYALWAELNAAKVAEAKARFNAPATDISHLIDTASLVAQVKASADAYGPHDTVDAANVADIALSTDENFRHLLPVTLESIVTNSSTPVRVWITARNLDASYRKWLSAAFPQVPITFLDYTGITYGVIGRMIEHITVATMDRLLLPEVLSDLPRVTYIDIDTVTLGDAGELAATDLKGFPLGARTSVYSGAEIWRAAGNKLKPTVAAELRRTMSVAHPFDFASLNAGVLVLDLERMRADNFVERFVPMAPAYGLNDQDVLEAYVGGERFELDPRWNALPVIESVDGAGIVHYAGAGKPWEPGIVPSGALWREYSARLAERAGEVPPLEASLDA